MKRKTNWSQAKEKTDKGRTHDKVEKFDPAAAPLGTDEEAGGATTPPEEIAESVKRRESATQRDRQQ